MYIKQKVFTQTFECIIVGYHSQTTENKTHADYYDAL